jgi:hypothetical protein
MRDRSLQEESETPLRAQASIRKTGRGPTGLRPFFLAAVPGLQRLPRRPPQRRSGRRRRPPRRIDSEPLAIGRCARDAWESTHPGDPGHTFTPRNPLVSDLEWLLELGRRIDYIMVRCGDHGPTLDVSACARIFDAPVDGV